MVMKEEDWSVYVNHIFRPRTDLTVASYKRVFKSMDIDITYCGKPQPEEEFRNIVIEYPRRMVSAYCERGVLWDDPRDLSRGMKCPCICINAGVDQRQRQYLYLRLADVPNKIYEQGFKGGRKKDQQEECTPDFSKIIASIPLVSSAEELTELWELATPIEILNRLCQEYGVYLGGEDYRQFTKERCKKIAAFGRGCRGRRPRRPARLPRVNM